GNQWMFRIGHPADHPLRVRPELLERPVIDALFPIVRETTPVRMDFTHSGWSDIFFLGMDFPEGARVINTSIDLCIHREGSDNSPAPPVEAYFRVIDQPILRLVSVDLEATAEISELPEVFDFARDYLGLLKAAVIASGIIPQGMEGTQQPLADLLSRVVKPGHGIEIVSRVNDIPKGSRLAVSTNLLACLIAVCMRATSQTRFLTGELNENERRVVASRAILGEWLGGSGGGWQDSGGIWPGMKLIEGARAEDGDPEFGISKGRLLPNHRIFTEKEASEETRRTLEKSLVLVHGGMAQDVGPILEMVTEKYLLRSEAEWRGRQEAIGILDEIMGCLKKGEIDQVGQATQRNFEGPIQTIIPWASNLFTETLIANVESEFGKGFHGFWMLGGMAGGGMGFIFDPEVKSEAQRRMQDIMSEAKRRFEKAVPFAMEPVVYDFTINESGTRADLLTDENALMPAGYYMLTVPSQLRLEPRALTAFRRAELDHFGQACRTDPTLAGMVPAIFDRVLPRRESGDESGKTLDILLKEHGFDRVQHEQIRAELRSGRIGLAQNRLPVDSRIEDVVPDDVLDATMDLPEKYRKTGMEALTAGTVAVVTLAAGAGSRWTKGAGVVKALNPFCKLSGKHRSFIEVHLAKSRRANQMFGIAPPHIFTTSYLTHDPISAFLKAESNYGYLGPLLLSPGRNVGQRMIPMVRDLRFAWEEMPQQ
ncbi:MAG: UTP--glucose-1-phosphate uridylyltransferase, partial [Opitutales bacterium]